MCNFFMFRKSNGYHLNAQLKNVVQLNITRYLIKIESSFLNLKTRIPFAKANLNPSFWYEFEHTNLYQYYCSIVSNGFLLILLHYMNDILPRV